MDTGARSMAYLFTDIDGSMERWERFPLLMQSVLARHDRIIDDIVARHGGFIRTRAGDGVFAEFEVGNPLLCALELQLALQREDWSAVGGLLVRIGVHAGFLNGEAAPDQISINRAARIMSSAWGGQIVVSAEAAKSYGLPDGGRLVDLGFCRLKGIDEPLQLFGLTHDRMDRTDFPPVKSLSIYTAAPSASPTPFFGREREYSEISELLKAPDTRLVTLVGPGGNGKTRLAARVATDFAERCAVWFVPLETVAASAELLTAIALALRFPLHGTRGQDEQLLEYLRDKHALLILDNADGVANDAGFVAKLCRTCPELRILATSREPLRLSGEVPYKLAGFEEPGQSADALRSSAAYQLFVHEAGMARPGFYLDQGEFDAFRTLCEVLDGSPLALRFAAQWRRLLSVEQIVDKVRRGLDFLHASEIDAPERQRSLRSVFVGSWALLSPDERSGLARLSIFSGDFDSDAAEVVARLELETLAALESKGLVERRGRDRLVMHPLMQEYARERLGGRKTDEQETRERHSAYYLDLIRTEFASMAAVGQCAILDRIEGETANLLSAWRYGLQGSKQRVRRAIEPIFYALVLRARYRDAVTFFQLGMGDRRYDTFFMSLLANCLVQQGDLEGAEAAAERVLGEGDCTHATRAHARQALGLVAHARGDLDAASAHYKSALSIRRKRGDALGCYFSTVSLAIVHLLRREIAEAREGIKQCFLLCQGLSNTSGMMLLHFLAGEVAAQEGRKADAKENYQRSLRLEDAVNHPQHRARALIRLGALSAELGDCAGALRWHREALEVAAEFGDQRYTASALVEIGAVLRMEGAFEQARSHLVRAIRITLKVGMRPILMQGLLELARLEVALAHHERAQLLATILAGAELGPLQEAYDALVAVLPRAPLAQDGGRTAEAAAHEIVDEEDLTSLLL